MRVLITGGSGFIGRRLASHLVHEHEVHIVVRRAPATVAEGVHLCLQDLTQDLDAQRLPPKIDAIIHLAQSRHYKNFPEKADDIYNINVGSTFSLLEYARSAGAKCFLFASTGGLYGTSYERFAETDHVQPINFYYSTKYSAELLIANFNRFFHTVVLRFFFPYGEGQSPAMLIPRLVRAVQTGEPIVLNGDRGLHINPLYIGDAVSSIAKAVRLEDSCLINLAGPRVLSLADIGHIAAEQLGVEPVFDVQASSEPTHLVGDITTMERLLGAPRTDFAEGVVEVCEEVRQQVGTQVSA